MQLNTNGMLKIMIAPKGPKIKEGEAIMYLDGPVKGKAEDIAELYKLITLAVARIKGKVEVKIS